MDQANKIIEVIPLVRLPRHQQFFDYSVPVELKLEPSIGDLVTVPWRRQIVDGVVVGIKKHSTLKIKLKNLQAIVFKNYMPITQLKLVKWVAEYYGVALSSALQLALPVLPNRRYQPNLNIYNGVVKKIKPSRPYIFAGGSAGEQTTVTASLIKKVLRRRQQVLVLVPTKFELRVWQQRLADYPVIIFSPSYKITEQRAVWEACRSGRPAVIIGLRSALFLPYVNLGGIIMTSADDASYKQWDQNPRYHGLAVARQLSQLTGTGLALISAAPSVELWQAANAGNLIWRNLAAPATKFTLIDMIKNRAGGDSGVISKLLWQAIKLKLDRGDKVFLYLNRRGTATAVLCPDCGFVPICLVCQRNLVWAENLKKLFCFHCNVGQDLIIPCVKCGGSKVDYKGIGLDRLNQEIIRLLPDYQPLIIEGDVTDAEVNLEHHNLIIGSQAAWSKLAWSDISLVALVAPDGEMTVPEFRSTEEVWQKIRRLLNYNVEVVVQTYRADNHIWKSFLKKDMTVYYKAELELREKYGYPPAVELARFTFQNQNQVEAKKQALKARQSLMAVLPAQSSLSPVYVDYYQSARGRYRYHILLKYQFGTKINQLWQVLPTAAIIDRQPLTVLS
ncbi:MAG: primosomal protein N' [Patescibacteria group bacterium]